MGGVPREEYLEMVERVGRDVIPLLDVQEQRAAA